MSAGNTHVLDRFGKPICVSKGQPASDIRVAVPCGKCRTMVSDLKRNGTTETPSRHPVQRRSVQGFGVSVVVPYRRGVPERDRNWHYLRSLYESLYPKWEVVVSDSDGEVFSRSRAIRNGIEKSSGDVLVVIDADCWVPDIARSVEAVAAGAPWVNPAVEVALLDEESTASVLATGNFSGSGRRGPKVPTGGAVVLARGTANKCGPDPRFVGWGYEDNAWTIALRAMFGQEVTSRETLWHLWHPKAPDADQNAPDANRKLYAEYRRTGVTPDVVKASRVRPRVCVVSDVRGWAFDVNAHDLADSLKDKFEFHHYYVEDWLRRKSNPDWSRYDVVYELFHRNPDMKLPRNRTVGALRSEWFDASRPSAPTDDDVKLVNSYRAFQVATYRNYEELHDKCPDVVYLTNPVNVGRFSRTPLREKIVAEWNGNAGHTSNGRQIKHFRDVVIPACLQAGVKLNVAEYGTATGPGRRRAPSEMPSFYLESNVALCASEYEAASNSVMEAMAAGLAVIATDVGNHRELRDAEMEEYGDTGIVLVERSVEAFVDALRSLTPKRAHEMGEVNRSEIERRWSWRVWRDRYYDFLAKAL